jgi:hypothetical protein
MQLIIIQSVLLGVLLTQLKPSHGPGALPAEPQLKFRISQQKTPCPQHCVSVEQAVTNLTNHPIAIREFAIARVSQMTIGPENDVSEQIITGSASVSVGDSWPEGSSAPKCRLLAPGQTFKRTIEVKLPQGAKKGTLVYLQQEYEDSSPAPCSAGEVVKGAVKSNRLKILVGDL